KQLCLSVIDKRNHFSPALSSESIPTKQVPRIYFLPYILQHLIQSVCDDDIGFICKLDKLIHNSQTFKFRFLQAWLVHNYFHVLPLQSFDNTLNGGLSKIIKACLHR